MLQLSLDHNGTNATTHDVVQHLPSVDLSSEQLFKPRLRSATYARPAAHTENRRYIIALKTALSMYW
jgi:hypothetical protein